MRVAFSWYPASTRALAAGLRRNLTIPCLHCCATCTNMGRIRGFIVRLFSSLAVSRRASAVLLWLVLAVLRCYPQANVQGQWTALSTWPTRAVHTTLLPDGRVFFVSYYTESTQPHIWDPATNTFSPTSAAAYELFCAGH